MAWNIVALHSFICSCTFFSFHSCSKHKTKNETKNAMSQIILLLRLVFLLVLALRCSNCSPIIYCNVSFSRLVIMFLILMKPPFLHIRACLKLKLLQHTHVLGVWDNGHPYLMLTNFHLLYAKHASFSFNGVVIHVQESCWCCLVYITDQSFLLDY